MKCSMAGKEIKETPDKQHPAWKNRAKGTNVSIDGSITLHGILSKNETDPGLDFI